MDAGGVGGGRGLLGKGCGGDFEFSGREGGGGVFGFGRRLNGMSGLVHRAGFLFL